MFFCVVHSSISPPLNLGELLDITLRMNRRNGWNLTCWYILATCRIDYTLVTVCWLSSFWHNFDLVKWIKFGLSVHYLENIWKEWPDVWHAHVSWPPSELIRFWWWLVIFSFWSNFDLEKWIKFVFYMHSLENRWTWNLACWCILTTFRDDQIWIMGCWFYLPGAVLN